MSCRVGSAVSTYSPTPRWLLSPATFRREPLPRPRRPRRLTRRRPTFGVPFSWRRMRARASARRSRERLLGFPLRHRAATLDKPRRPRDAHRSGGSASHRLPNLLHDLAASRRPTMKDVTDSGWCAIRRADVAAEAAALSDAHRIATARAVARTGQARAGPRRTQLRSCDWSCHISGGLNPRTPLATGLLNLEVSRIDLPDRRPAAR
jgi:hypothetical protein